MDINSLNEYRIGIIGTPSCGKTALISLFQESTGLRIPTAETNAPSKETEVTTASNRAICVLVSEGGLFGLRLCRHKIFSDFACIDSFVRSPLGGKYEIEASNRVQLGDILIAVNDTSLANLTPHQAAHVLRQEAAKCQDEPVIVSFLRPATDATQEADDEAIKLLRPSPLGPSPTSIINEKDESEYVVMNPNFSSIEDSELYLSEEFEPDSHVSSTILVDQPSVGVHCSLFTPTVPTTSTKESATGDEERLCLLEIVEIPADDNDDIVLREWMSRLDGIILVYTAESVESLVALERRYAKVISKVIGEELYNLPICVVCNKYSETDPTACELKLEGASLADAWAAPFFSLSLRVAGVGTLLDTDKELINTIFSQVIDCVDRKVRLQSDSSAAVIKTSFIASTWSMFMGSFNECGIPIIRTYSKERKRISNIAYSDDINGASILNGIEKGNGKEGTFRLPYSLLRRCEDTHDVWKFDWASRQIMVLQQSLLERHVEVTPGRE